MVKDAEDKENDTSEQETPAEEELDTEALKSKLADVEGKLTQAQQDLTSAQEEGKAHQRASQKKESEVQRLKGDFTNLDKKMDILAEIIEEGRTTTDEFEERKTSKTYKQRLEEVSKDTPDPRMEELKVHAREVADEIISILPEGKKLEKAKEFRNAYVLWQIGDVDAALEEVKEVVGKMTVEKEAPKDEKDEEIARLKIENEKLKGIQSGALTTETGQSAGVPKNDLEAEQSYNEGKISWEDLPETIKKKHTG